MGGASTEISGETTSVALEMAWWDPQTISTSSRRLGLRSEASIRFERGADPEVADLAMRRFAELLSDSGATLAPGTVDVRGTVPDRSPVRVRTDRVNALLGTDLSRDEMADLLEPIGFTSEAGPRRSILSGPRRRRTLLSTRQCHGDRRGRGGGPDARVRAHCPDRPQLDHHRVADPLPA
ncbi:MAG: hypothetical protein Ct9H300mP12_04220 [Acidimicrobiales bacterium]|nr:MAG: hypothetical protein Ct9H300mP12_04220 [Acidimicrobiales bacterium]